MTLSGPDIGCDACGMYGQKGREVLENFLYRGSCGIGGSNRRNRSRANLLRVGLRLQLG